MPSTINHIAISVSDMERSLSLYRDILGMEEIMDFNTEGMPEFAQVFGMKEVKERIVMLGAGEINIELFKVVNPKPKKNDRQEIDLGYMHLAIMVEDFDRIVCELEKKDIIFLSEPKIMMDSMKVVFFKGFDGETIEMMMYI